MTPGIVRLLSPAKGDNAPIIMVRETGAPKVTYLFWPRNAAYDQASRAAKAYHENCLSRAVEAPCL